MSTEEAAEGAGDEWRWRSDSSSDESDLETVESAEEAASRRQGEAIRDEIARGLAEKAVKDPLFDILGWWVHNNNELKLKILGDLPREWWPIIDWFFVARDRLAMEDPERMSSDGIRIGREEEADLWIDVRMLTPKMLREVMMVHTMMAAADYDLWLKTFLRVSNCQVPSSIRLEPGMKIALKYTITIPSEFDLGTNGEEIAKYVFGSSKFTDGFYVDYPKIHTATTSKGVNVIEIEPIPVKLRIAPTGGGYQRQIAAIHDIQALVKRIKGSEGKREKKLKWYERDLATPPALNLESIELDFRHLTIYPPVLKALEKLIATVDTRIRVLHLPSNHYSGAIDMDKTRTAWASLLRTIFGSGELHTEKSISVQIGHLAIPAIYSTSELFFPLLMCAKSTQCVKSLKLDFASRSQRGRASVDHIFGAGLAYAFMATSAQNSILELDLGSIGPSKRFVEAMSAVAISKEPLELFWTYCTCRPYPSLPLLM